MSLSLMHRSSAVRLARRSRCSPWPPPASPGPGSYQQAKLEAYECGIEPSRSRSAAAVPDQVLSDGDALHRLRHEIIFSTPGVSFDACRSSACGDGLFIVAVFVAYARLAAPARLGLREELRWESKRSPRRVLLTRWRSSSTCRGSRRLGALRPGLLRDRDDGRRRSALRHGPLGHGGLRASPDSRPDDRGGRVSQIDGAGATADLPTRWPSPAGCCRWACCASSGGMFNNYAIVQGVDHVVPVDMYLRGAPPAGDAHRRGVKCARRAGTSHWAPTAADAPASQERL